jgi:hypothetical protein
MNEGLKHLLIGIVVLGVGLAITLLSHKYVTYGAIAVGVFEIVRGLYVLWTGRKNV